MGLGGHHVTTLQVFASRNMGQAHVEQESAKEFCLEIAIQMQSNLPQYSELLLKENRVCWSVCLFSPLFHPWSPFV